MPWIVINALCHLKNYTALRDNWELNPPHTILPPHLATQIDIIIQQQSKRCVLPNPAFKLNSVTPITQFPRRPFRPSFKSHFFFPHTNSSKCAYDSTNSLTLAHQTLSRFCQIQIRLRHNIPELQKTKPHSTTYIAKFYTILHQSCFIGELWIGNWGKIKQRILLCCINYARFTLLETLLTY